MFESNMKIGFSYYNKIKTCNSRQMKNFFNTDIDEKIKHFIPS